MRTRTPTASADLTRVLLLHGSRLGIDARELCRAAGIEMEELERGEARIHHARFGSLWDAVASRGGDADLGLHFGEAIVSSASGHLLLAVLRNCPTVADAIDRFFRYHDILADFIHPEVKRSGDMVYVRWSPTGAVAAHRHHVEAVFSTFVTTLRRLTEDRIQIQAVRFCHPTPASVAEHARVLGAPVRFDAPANEVVFERRSLAAAIPLASTELLRGLEALAQKQLARLRRPATWAETTANALNAAIFGGRDPAIGPVAASLGVSARTLQAKLSQERTTYRALLDTVRREVATVFLARPDLSLCDVAFLLGFSEQSAFNHAFRRWTGMTPREFRGKGSGDRVQ